MLLVAPLGIFVVGPIANFLTIGLSDVLGLIININPIIIGVAAGAIWQVLVVLGVHGLISLVPILLLLQTGTSTILGIGGIVAFSQIGVVSAIQLKTKNQKLKGIAKSSIISGLLGVTEPAIYGVTEPRRKMFVISCIGGAIAGYLVGYYGLVLHTLSGIGVFSLFGFLDPVDPNVTGILMAVFVPAIISFILAFIVFSDKRDVTKFSKNIEKLDENMNLIDPFAKVEEVVNVIDEEYLKSPVNGEIINNSEVHDEVFASEVLGKTMSLISDDGKVFAPADATIVALFPTKHAVGLKTIGGVEILLHIGIDTVKLQGEHFESKVSQGDVVKQGQIIVEFDHEAIKELGYELDIPMIITNSDEYSEFVQHENEIVTSDDDVLTIIY